ncbi:hypothetical protein [Kutzneria buriramensis]|uniref:Uncharacterized protein n=1 Tax=Kutzneria buriramensis TaxID=1045776 RepID=A0A3E0HHJ8_9PSEU|nr:hypothetical protein [Kutzneria buriramensis]REH45931.1 hypothetical protein BCF44_10763 [Kutzneria buriramensis]
MRLILTHRNDFPARALATRWGSEALLLTVDELHRTRWNLELDSDGQVRTELADESGAPVPVDGVVNRLGVVRPSDLPHVHREDRPYAAAELTAFLLAWLDACPVPVLNRPDSGWLSGPAWYPEQWAAEATALGLRVATRRQRVALAAAEPVLVWDKAISASVVGDRCFGDVHPAVGERLCALADAAGATLLAATVAGPRPDAQVRDFSTWPDVSDPMVADAIATTLVGVAR